ncbi:MAG: hypothetical protein IPM22_12260 [Betaproteobacteria bacterium]|nr:hypothetical protein [Betaproteobacteria bacterium]
MQSRHTTASTVSRYVARARGAAAVLTIAALAAVGTGSGAAAGIDPVKEALRAELGSGLVAKSFAVAPQAGETVVTVVEYYHAGLGHFFVTADPAEVANLDAGAFGGVWKRTGQTFGAWAMAGRPADSVPVCRFFGTDQYRANGTRIGPNSHFYTADPAECAYVKTAWPSIAASGVSYPAWTYESDAFAVKLASGGACPVGTEALYRAYNDGAGGDPNHRYVVDPRLLEGMPGWVFEGAVMCHPVAKTTLPFTVVGEIRGCDRPECRVPDAQGSGLGLVDVVMDLSVLALPTAATGGPGAKAWESYTIELPAGTQIININWGSGGPAAGGSYQDGVLVDDAKWEMPIWAQAPGTIKVMLSLYCLQQSRKPADTNATYELAGSVTDPGILAIVRLPRPRPIVNQSLTATATQFAIWEVTDGKGPLSAAQLDQLRKLYALPETDPEFVVIMTEFMTSLSVVGTGP